MALSNQLDEALLECDLNMFKSYFYPMAKGGIIALLSVSSLDRVSFPTNSKRDFQCLLCHVLIPLTNPWILTSTLEF